MTRRTSPGMARLERATRLAFARLPADVLHSLTDETVDVFNNHVAKTTVAERAFIVRLLGLLEDAINDRAYQDAMRELGLGS